LPTENEPAAQAAKEKAANHSPLALLIRLRCIFLCCAARLREAAFKSTL